MPRHFLEGITEESASEAFRVESALATARLILTFAAFVAIYLDPAQPSVSEVVRYPAIACYALFSLLVLAFLRSRGQVTRVFVRTVHVVSMAFATLISASTTGSSFFIFFLFVILAAAFRWRFRETMITTAVLAMVLVGEGLLLVDSPLGQMLVGTTDATTFLMRALYLVIIGILVGYLGEKGKEAAGELAGLRRLSALPTAENTMQAALTRTARALGGLFECLVVVRYAPDDIIDGAPIMLRTSWYERSSDWQPDFDGGRDYPFQEESSAGRIQLQRRPIFTSVAGNRMGRSRALQSVDPDIKERQQGAIVARMKVQGSWTAQFALLDPHFGMIRNFPVLFLHRAMKQLTPVHHNVFLRERIGEEVSAMERARLARELHDGAVQSLIGIEYQIEGLWRRSVLPDVAAHELLRIKDLVRKESLAVRMLMDQLNTSNVIGASLVSEMRRLIDGFKAQSHIEIEFNADERPVRDLDPRACSEILRITREALVNAWKHSGANNVSVRFERCERMWRLSVSDNGRGFDFDGIYTLSELNRQKLGPVVIKERVRALGGNLELSSSRSGGATLNIMIPYGQS